MAQLPRQRDRARAAGLVAGGLPPRSRAVRRDAGTARGMRALIVYGGWDGHQPAEFARFYAAQLRDEGLTVELSDSLEALRNAADVDLVVPIWTMGTIAPQPLRALLHAGAGEPRGTSPSGCRPGGGNPSLPSRCARSSTRWPAASASPGSTAAWPTPSATRPTSSSWSAASSSPTPTASRTTTSPSSTPIAR